MSTSAGRLTPVGGGGRWPQMLQQDAKLEDSGDDYGGKGAFDDKEE